MPKRLLDCCASDFRSFTKSDLLESIQKSEGRVIACETIGTVQPLLGNVTNAEFAASMGADILLLNMFDVQHPVINGLPETEPENTVRMLKKLTAAPSASIWSRWPRARRARQTPSGKCPLAAVPPSKTPCEPKELGVDFILLTGNPGMGVSNPAIIETLRKFKAAVGDSIVLAAGKMHAAGVLTEAAESILTEADIADFTAAGADIILLPAPGTVPGITMEYARTLISCAHRHGALTITAIGTSQEGADTDTIRRIALMCKMAGTDIHHIGDTGYTGMALAENIMAYSIAVRGIRHTYHRMAISVER